MLSGISIPSLLIILAIVVVLFGTKKLRNIGSDLGSAIRSFRKAVKDDDKPDDDQHRTLENQSDKKDD